MAHGCRRHIIRTKRGGNIVNVRVAAGLKTGGSTDLKMHKTRILRIEPDWTRIEGNKRAVRVQNRKIEASRS